LGTCTPSCPSVSASYLCPPLHAARHTGDDEGWQAGISLVRSLLPACLHVHERRGWRQEASATPLLPPCTLPCSPLAAPLERQYHPFNFPSQLQSTSRAATMALDSHANSPQTQACTVAVVTGAHSCSSDRHANSQQAPVCAQLHQRLPCNAPPATTV